MLGQKSLYLIDEFVRLRLPGWRLSGRRVELVVEQREGLLTLDGVAGKEVAVAERKLELDVESVGAAPGDERGPQPVVDVVVADVAHDVRSPVD